MQKFIAALLAGVFAIASVNAIAADKDTKKDEKKEAKK
jgi:hypothetical protein